MNNQARICNLKCKHNIQGICHAYGECIAKDLFIAELESLKAEIGEAYPHFDSADVHWGFNICRDIIDNHIKELKGECNAIK